MLLGVPSPRRARLGIGIPSYITRATHCLPIPSECEKCRLALQSAGACGRFDGHGTGGQLYGLGEAPQTQGGGKDAPAPGPQ